MLQHFENVGRWPDLKRPQTFNEKVLHRKLHEQNAFFALCSDKALVKEHVRERIGEKYVTPTIWSGQELPDAPGRDWPTSFVVKANHASGWNIFIKESVEPDEWQTIRETSRRWMLTPWHFYLHERWYNRVPRQLLVEEFIGRAGQPPPDIKFFVFGGSVRLVQIDVNRFKGHQRRFYSRDWERLNVSLCYPQPKEDSPAPMHLCEMVELAETLGEGQPFVRIDFYELPSGPRFGEMTFAPGGGIQRFSPASADALLGSYWTGRTF